MLAVIGGAFGVQSSISRMRFLSCVRCLLDGRCVGMRYRAVAFDAAGAFAKNDVIGVIVVCVLCPFV